MLYIVIRQIENWAEPLVSDHRVFAMPAQAEGYYTDADSICRDGPDDTPGSNPAVVTHCWLWAADSDDPVMALEMVRSERAVLLEVCFPLVGE